MSSVCSLSNIWWFWGKRNGSAWSCPWTFFGGPSFSRARQVSLAKIKSFSALSPRPSFTRTSMLLLTTPMSALESIWRISTHITLCYKLLLIFDIDAKYYKILHLTRLSIRCNLYCYHLTLTSCTLVKHYTCTGISLIYLYTLIIYLSPYPAII